MIYRVINKICRTFDITIVFHSKVGVKYFNSHYSSDNFEYLCEEKPFQLKKDELFLGPDKLKDQHSLIDLNIVNSPHFYLMKCIMNNEDIMNTEYIKRFKKGTLDNRLPRKNINKLFLTHMKDKFNKKLKLINSNDYSPIKVYKNNNRFYIADGKHTAAMCALLNKNIKCVEVPGIKYDSFVIRLYKKMLERENEYSKHIKFYEIYL